MNMVKIEVQIVKHKPQSEYQRLQVLKKMALLYGGASVLSIEGVWYNEATGLLEADDSWLVYSYTPTPDEGVLIDLARSVAIALNEVAVMLVIGNDVMFVGKD